MKLSELVAQLEALKAKHGDIAVMVDGYEDGFDYPGGIAVIKVAAQESGWWSGDYDEARDSRDSAFPAVVIHR